MLLTPTYGTDLSRVRIAVSSNTAPTLVLERSTDQVRWTTVRGATAAVLGTTGTLDDYEFSPGVVNYYRATGSDASTASTSITPGMNEAWLKVPGAPYLNRTVSLIGWDEISRASRSGIFEVSARREPVVVSERHTTRSTTVRFRTTTVSDRESLDTLLSVGQVVLLHLPAGSVLPSMYFVPGEYSYRRPAQRSVVSVFEVPVREVARPSAAVVGSAGTWQTLVSSYATWSNVLAAKPTWGQVAELVGSGNDLIVS